MGHSTAVTGQMGYSLAHWYGRTRAGLRGWHHNSAGTRKLEKSVFSAGGGGAACSDKLSFHELGIRGDSIQLGIGALRATETIRRTDYRICRFPATGSCQPVVAKALQLWAVRMVLAIHDLRQASAHAPEVITSNAKFDCRK